eukprot:3988565-Lingulodinium_polyedra.AAC.1
MLQRAQTDAHARLGTALPKRVRTNSRTPARAANARELLRTRLETAVSANVRTNSRVLQRTARSEP